MALSYLSSAFGNPFHLHTDKITARRKRISYARVCVEVDASTELVKEFDPRCDNGEWITIKAELEWVPAKCTTCGVFGHSIARCGKQKTSREGTGLMKTDKETKSSEVWVEVKKKGKGKVTMDDAAILEDGLGKVVVLGDPSGTKNSNEPVGDMARNVTSPQETLELHQTGGRGMHLIIFYSRIRNERERLHMNLTLEMPVECPSSRRSRFAEA